MTPKQKAAQIYDEYWSAVSRGPVCKTDELPDMRPLLEQAIIAAEEEGAKREREAIKQMIDEMTGIVLPRNDYPFMPIKYLNQVLIPVPDLIAAICARSQS